MYLATFRGRGALFELVLAIPVTLHGLLKRAPTLAS